ncbi:uncharacterized protein LOC132901795 [Amyelois transitella]|uniref:uncharacterized protein LOC132901795 n=1 Tax=Amyelois transitella TaxID=680683 RepID=UPI00299025CE|nr:uncharacterized protein LOC132901795 [Amyelois transitella]
MYPRVLRGFYSQLEKAARASGFVAGKSGRHMKFPYTFSAKIAQFPIFFYCKHNRTWMYYPWSCMLSFYFFGKIHAIVNSDENKRSWAETQRKAAEKEHEH